MTILRTLSLLTLAVLLPLCAVAQTMDVDVTAIKELARKWNAAHKDQSIQELAEVYSASVHFYGSNLSREKCIARKKTELNTSRNFEQSIGKDLLLTAYTTGLIRCDIKIIQKAEQKSWKKSIYMIVQEENGKYVIIAEGNERSPQSTYLGPKLIIKDVPLNNLKTDTRQKWTGIVDMVLIISSSALGIFLFLLGFKKWRDRKYEKRQRLAPLLHSGPSSWRKLNISSARSREKERPTSDMPDHKQKGDTFEKYVVKQFDRTVFTLLDWRSDKYHAGIFPQSSRDPDLLYQYKLGNISRKFSVECKYRSRPSHDLVTLMNEEKYRIYESYHRGTAPVYIVLGLGGKPFDPLKFYLIPFAKVKTAMTTLELAKFKKHKRSFFYDVAEDRLK